MRKVIFFLISALFLGSVIFILFSGKSFMLFSKEEFYPSSDTTIGFISKANKLLAAALEECDETINPVTLSQLNRKYPRLHFFVPEGMDPDSTFTSRKEDIRLDAILPANNEEKAFMYNSRLADLLKKQREDPFNEFFRITFDFKSLNVKSIQVVRGAIRTPLVPKEWDGVIKEAIPGIFSRDTCWFVISDKNFIAIPNRGNGRGVPYDLDFKDKGFYKDGQDELLNPIDLENNFLRENYRAFLRMKLLDLAEQPDLNFYISHDTLWLQDINGFNYSILADGKEVSFENQIVVNWHAITLSGFDNVDVALRNTAVQFRITRHYPLENVSFPLHLNEKMVRNQMNSNVLDVFTLQAIPVISSVKGLTKGGKTNLTVDPLFSSYLETKMNNYVQTVINSLSRNGRWDERPGEKLEMATTFINAANGEIIAVPWVSSSDNKERLTQLKNLNFINHGIGSTFKPLLTLACDIKCPGLVNFTLTRNHVRKNRLPDGSGRATIFGFPITERNFERIKPSNLKNTDWYADVPMTQVHFLAKSHDLYPVAIGILASFDRKGRITDEFVNAINHNSDRLQNIPGNFAGEYQVKTEPGEPLDINNNSNTLIRKLESNSALYSHIIPTLYNIDRTNNRVYDFSVWCFDSTENNDVFQLITPELSSTRSDLLGTLDVVNNYERTSLNNEYIPWVLGQGIQQWSNVKLAEAYARLLTRKDIKAKFLKAMDTLLDIPSKLSGYRVEIGDYNQQDINNIWGQFQNTFLQAQDLRVDGNTLLPAKTRIDAVSAELNDVLNNPVMVLSKTGTLAAAVNLERNILYSLNQKILIDDALYVFCIFPQTAWNSIQFGQPFDNAGIVGVIYLKHTYPLTESEARNKDFIKNFGGLWSSECRDFLTNDIIYHTIIHNINLFDPRPARRNH